MDETSQCICLQEENREVRFAVGVYGGPDIRSGLRAKKHFKTTPYS